MLQLCGSYITLSLRSIVNSLNSQNHLVAKFRIWSARISAWLVGVSIPWEYVKACEIIMGHVLLDDTLQRLIENSVKPATIDFRFRS